VRERIHAGSSRAARVVHERIHAGSSRAARVKRTLRGEGPFVGFPVVAVMNVLIVPRQMKVPPQLFFAPPIALVRVSMHFTAEYASEQDADVVDHPFEAVMFAHHLWIKNVVPTKKVCQEGPVVPTQ